MRQPAKTVTAISIKNAVVNSRMFFRLQVARLVDSESTSGGGRERTSALTGHPERCPPRQTNAGV
jgi:hypothetical protein